MTGYIFISAALLLFIGLSIWAFSHRNDNPEIESREEDFTSSFTGTSKPKDYKELPKAPKQIRNEKGSCKYCHAEMPKKLLKRMPKWWNKRKLNKLAKWHQLGCYYIKALKVAGKVKS